MATSQALKKLTSLRSIHGSSSSSFTTFIAHHHHHHHHQYTESNGHGIITETKTIRRRWWWWRSRASWMEVVALPPQVLPSYPLSSSSSPSRIISQKRHYCSGKEEKNEHCWSCGESRGRVLVCPRCTAVQSPDPSITYFQIFDQDQKYEMDPKDLEAKYKMLMKKLHPDLFHGKSKEEMGNSAQLSALVTRAYDELLSPVSRATYLLKLQGVHVEEEGTVNDPELILEVMELREALESNPDKETLEQLHKTANDRMMHWSDSFNNAFKEGNTASAVSALQRMSYFGRLCEAIKRELL